MSNARRFARATSIALLSLAILASIARPASATGNVVKSDLKGTWRVSLHGLTAACGYTTAQATITFGSTGSGTGPLQLHGTTCGTSTLPGQTMTVNTLAKNGEGTVTLTCGAGCQWPFTIQVSPDRTKFNLTDVTPDTDIVAGLAILSSTADHVAVADLKGDWTLTLMGRQLENCESGGADVPLSIWGTVSLNTAGAGAMSFTIHGPEGNFTGVTDFAIGTLNADGSGTALIECDFGVWATFGIQVSPDRSVFNLVNVSPAEPTFLAGAAVRRSTAGHITPTNLAGAWQGTQLTVEDSGDVEAGLATFKANAKAVTKKMTVVLHGTDGDGTITNVGLAVSTLNPDGSGAICISVVTACESTVRIQVSPDRTVIIGVGVDDPDNREFSTGVFIAQ